MTLRAIVGGPKTGKTTMSSPDAKHTDDTIPLGWDKAIETVSGWFGKAEEIEGVQVARGLRKWLEDNPTGKPCDEVVHLTAPVVPRTRGQAIMAKGIETVLREIRPELERRGVVIRDVKPVRTRTP